jgi:gas vesicle protein
MAKNNSKWAIGAILAAAGGFLAGILTAPKSGKETREDIGATAKIVAKVADKRLDDVHEELNTQINRVKKMSIEAKDKAGKELKDAYSAALRAKDAVAAKIKDMTDGAETSEKEIAAAVKEAKEVVEKLKTKK